MKNMISEWLKRHFREIYEQDREDGSVKRGEKRFMI